MDHRRGDAAVASPDDLTVCIRPARRPRPKACRKARDDLRSQRFAHTPPNPRYADHQAVIGHGSESNAKPPLRVDWHSLSVLLHPTNDPGPAGHPYLVASRRGP